MGVDEQRNGDGRKEGRKSKYAVACSIVGSIISILMGYDTGVMSGAMLFIKDDLKTNDTQVQVLAGILNICALVGSLTAGRVSDWAGRRRTISFAATIFFAGSVLMGLAPNFATLLVGRCVAGVGVGYALMIAPVYAAEIASAESRGALSSLPDICISLGILLGYVANYLLAKLPLVYGWRAMLGLGALPSAALAVGVYAMPESPRWLVMQGRTEEARVRNGGRGPGAAGRDQGRGGAPRRLRPGRAGAEEQRQGRVEGALSAPDAARAAHPRGGPGRAFLQLPDGHRGRAALQPANLQGRWHRKPERGSRGDRRRGRDQDGVHPGGDPARGPHWPTAALPGQPGGHHRLSGLPRTRAHRHRALVGGARPPRRGAVGGGAGHRHGVHLRGVLLRRRGPRHVDLQLGGVPATAARAGHQRGRGHQPPHQRHRVHDVRVAVQGHYHRRRILPVRGAVSGSRRVLLLPVPRDAGPTTGGGRGGVQPRVVCCAPRRGAAGGGDEGDGRGRRQNQGATVM